MKSRKALISYLPLASLVVSYVFSVSCAGSGGGSHSKDNPQASQSIPQESEGDARMPAEPTRTATFVDKKRNDTVFSVGVKGGLLGNEAGVSNKVKFALSWESTLTLVRHAPSDQDQIVMIDSKGDTQLNYANDVAFVGSCKFVASATASVSLVGALKVFGAGVENTSDLERSLTTDAKTGLFAIKPEDKLAELQERCKKSKESVTKDLIALIANNVILNGNPQPQSGEQKAALAAVHGPEIKGVSVFGQEWNVKPAQIEKLGELFRVVGQLSLRKPLLADTQIFYTIEIGKGGVVSAKYQGAEGDSDWEKAAKQLADLIATEAFIDHSEG